jgi:hypothetical protein
LPKGVIDFRHAYTMRMQGIVSELCCFYTKASIEEAVLGYGLAFTRNPKTGSVDYVEVYPSGLMSSEVRSPYSSPLL